MSDLARFPPGSCCTAVGWGINGSLHARDSQWATKITFILAENQLSSILQKVSIPIHNENACNGLVGWKESIIRSGRQSDYCICLKLNDEIGSKPKTIFVKF